MRHIGVQRGLLVHLLTIRDSVVLTTSAGRFLRVRRRKVNCVIILKLKVRCVVHVRQIMSIISHVDCGGVRDVTYGSTNNTNIMTARKGALGERVRRI